MSSRVKEDFFSVVRQTIKFSESESESDAEGRQFKWSLNKVKTQELNHTVNVVDYK